MLNLQSTHPIVHRKFLMEGLHVIRRSDSYWAGLSSDLIIEQTLMRSLKTSGGLTRGRGMNDIQRIVWLLSTPVCAAINETIQNITGVQTETSEQHKELMVSRLGRDFRDAAVITRHMYERKPFDRANNDLINIETGEVSTAANVQESKKIGDEILNEMV